ncbi:DUF551 domain-containing protein [Pantoea sp. GM01]|uniref:DUF551 domain-containing protein n=1 Tax=Pantoea sp. GM01 TaxID=1144320 RepID=UPI000270FFDA|nr:DUF551 domain-containing protein [Pantoea sp. GM01]EJL90239.1 Protein of unknown function (DUF551) [Pantoea sp. GM01]
MRKLTVEKCQSVIEGFKWMASEGPGMSIRDEYDLQAYQIALPVLEQQGEWISCSERMPPIKKGVLVGCWYGREWATKWATLIHGHPDASNEGWLIPGASWVPTHWHELPAPLQVQPTTDTYRQIENDGWIEWGGGECPVKTNALVDYRTRAGNTADSIALALRWAHKGWDGDIIAYRVIENDGREG